MGLFFSGGSGGGVGVLGGGGVEVAEFVLGSVGVDGCVSGACGCGVIAAWAGWGDGGVLF